MPPKKKLKLDDTVDTIYETGFAYTTRSSAELSENVVKQLKTVNYRWNVRYEVVRDNDSLGIEIFVDFNSRYAFKDKVNMTVTMEAAEEKIVKMFDLEKKTGQKFVINFIEADADNIENKDIKVTCKFVVFQMEYCSESNGTRAVFTSPSRPHDVVLLVEDKKVYVLKQYLATWSNYFNKLFYGDSADQEKKELKIDDVDAKEFNELLHIVHPSLLKKVQDYNVLYLLELAARFEMPSVVSMCGTYLADFGNLPSVGLMERLALSDKHNISHLQVACLKNLHAMTAAEQQAFRYVDFLRGVNTVTSWP